MTWPAELRPNTALNRWRCRGWRLREKRLTEAKGSLSKLRRRLAVAAAFIESYRRFPRPHNGSPHTLPPRKLLLLLLPPWNPPLFIVFLHISTIAEQFFPPFPYFPLPSLAPIHPLLSHRHLFTPAPPLHSTSKLTPTPPPYPPHPRSPGSSFLVAHKKRPSRIAFHPSVRL